MKRVPPTSPESNHSTSPSVETATDAKPTAPEKIGIVDERLQLVNDRARGTIEEVSLPEAAITVLHGILLDFDPDRLLPTIASTATRADPKKLWKRVVRKWLTRHDVFAKAKIVASGRGLHVLLRLSPAVVFETEADRTKWAAVVKIIQKLLPSDPDCPGITALTRPVGSINGKNGQKVRRLHKGETVSPDEVLALCAQARERPFATVAALLFADSHISPCPVCLADGSRLDVLDHFGTCYGGCGKVRIGQLFDRFLKPRAAKKGDE